MGSHYLSIASNRGGKESNSTCKIRGDLGSGCFLLMKVGCSLGAIHHVTRTPLGRAQKLEEFCHY